jgi:mRNA-degrading endonuclease HigB of HigAB toxin-antitoxin module
MLKVVNSENPPLRLVLGKPALDAIREKYKMVEEELKAWEDVTLNTSFDQ